ncbi:hypothetical protein [Mesorhizobium sp.]|uniref:hypothetical protein n=1 Tax=Mesorhizobium sp. TaxID=1871066 RepID=UPI0025F87C37|nr:hypothetical protein [Mesorhizobium sp.]
MSFLAKKASGFATDRAGSDNNIETHGIASLPGLMERREYRSTALKIARELPNLEQVLP